MILKHRNNFEFFILFIILNMFISVTNGQGINNVIINNKVASENDLNFYRYNTSYNKLSNVMDNFKNNRTLSGSLVRKETIGLPTLMDINERYNVTPHEDNFIRIYPSNLNKETIRPNINKPNYTNIRDRFLQHLRNQTNLLSTNEKYLNSIKFGPIKSENNTEKNFRPFVVTTTGSGIENTIANPEIPKPTTESSELSDARKKQLKLQFVLDCALVDPITKERIPLNNQTNPYDSVGTTTTLATTTTESPKTAVSFEHQTTAPTTTTPIFLQVVKKVSSQPTKQKHKNVYVNPPVFEEIGNVMENVYNLLEDTLVTKVIEKRTTPTIRKIYQLNVTPAQMQQIRSTKRPNQQFQNRLGKRTTYMPYNPNRRTTKSMPKYPVTHSDRDKNYLTTQIHVTSAYNGPQRPDSQEELLKRKQNVRDKSSEEDEYYYDSLTLDGLNLDSGSYSKEDDDDRDEDDDDDDEEDEDDDEDEDEEDDDDDDAEGANNEISPQRKEAKSKKKPKLDKKRRRNSKKPSDKPVRKVDDEEEEYDYGPSMGMFGNFFGNFFSSVRSFIPSLPPFGRYDSGDSNDLSEERSTTPRIDLRKPKKPSYIFSDDFLSDDNILDSGESFGSIVGASSGESSDGSPAWYYPSFIFGSNDYSDVQTTPISQTESSDYWNWFGSEEKPEASDNKPNKTGWFFNMFTSGRPTTTSTRRPFLTIENPSYKPHNWLGILAQQLASTQRPPMLEPIKKKISYDNYQLWRLLPDSEANVKFLEEYRSTPEGAKLQWWKGPTLRGPTDIAIPPDVIADVKESLDYEEIPHEIVMWDLERAIQYENPKMSRREKLEMEISQEHPMTWYRYHRYDDIRKYLEFLQRKYSKYVELINIGRSFEGRPLIVAKISGEAYETENWKGKLGPSERKKKRTKRTSVFVESGVHAREWIGPAVSTWILDKLVRGIEQNDSLGETIRSKDWYILPVLNPDGYEYSHEYDRMWRKNRSKYKEEPTLFSSAFNWLRKENKFKEDADDCYGTDLNRNWNIEWNQKGASLSKCSDFYAGPSAFSEPETKALSKFLLENKKYIKLFLSLHSYGQMITYPTNTNSSYNSLKPDDLLDMAQVAIEALRGMGSSTRYVIDNANEMIFPHSGSADAYALNGLDIKYSYTLELRDTGTHGFLLPPSNIDVTARETFEIIKGMVDYM